MDSDHELVSTDSGRSDTWRFDKGVFEVNRRADRRDIVEGVITEKSPIRSVEDDLHLIE